MKSRDPVPLPTLPPTRVTYRVASELAWLGYAWRQCPGPVRLVLWAVAGAIAKVVTDRFGISFDLTDLLRAAAAQWT